MNKSFAVAGSRRFNRSKNFSLKILTPVSFSLSGSTASRLLLFSWGGAARLFLNRQFLNKTIEARKMKPMRSPARSCPHRTIGQGGASIGRAVFAVAAMGILSACEQNTFVPPPPAKVDVAVPLQRSFTRYLEATGNTAAIKNVDLVARVQGFLQSINYKDGAFVKEGTSLFTIEPDTYKLKLEQAQAAESGAQASVRQTEADF
ncbi:MAG TPA: biotin/lipoyl-binding protein, partial [Burkholderiales bacterium]|nr:biotin/lipoyl-binding protein [Burkholderiales bacterium]